MRRFSENLVWLLASIVGTGFWVSVSYLTLTPDEPAPVAFFLNAMLVVFLLSDYLAIKKVLARG